jgi:hypothetical protein
MINWAYWFFGLDNGSGSKYMFWSGIGSDITEFAVVGALLSLLRKHNCEAHRCWRIGRHEWTDPATGISHKLCRRHHPLGPLTVAGIAESEESVQ